MVARAKVNDCSYDIERSTLYETSKTHEIMEAEIFLCNQELLHKPKTLVNKN